MIPLHGVLRSALVAALISTGSSHAQGQEAQPIKVMIVQQASAQAAKLPEREVDLTRYILRGLQEKPKYTAFLLTPGMTELNDAVRASKLDAADARAPFSQAALHRIGSVLGVNAIVRVSAWFENKGNIAAAAIVEERMGQASWSTTNSIVLEPYKAKSGSGAVLEGALAQSNLLIQSILGEKKKSPEPLNPPDPPKGEPEKKPAAPVTKAPDVKTAASPATNSPKPPDLATPSNAARKPTPQPVDNRPQVSSIDVLVDRFRQAGDRANLMSSLRKAVGERPRDARVRIQLIECYREAGWMDAAKDEASRAVTLVPDSVPLRRLYGETLIQDGKLDLAITELQAAIRSDEKDPLSYVALGDAYLAGLRFEDAEKAYSAASKLNARTSLPHRKLANLQARKGKFAEAIASMKTAAQATSDNEFSEYVKDYAALLRLGEAHLGEIMVGFQTVRKDVLAQSRTRETLYKEVDALKARGRAISDFLAELPAPTGYTRIQALYGQAAAMVVQASETLQVWVSSNSDADDKEFTLLRLEAGRQIKDASDRLKALTSAKS